ncbi:MAG: hypothetical protein JWQ11_4719 [Rhizobacter sp.]|nr:hypothetical protein [Rhizobacter sp.]
MIYSRANPTITLQRRLFKNPQIEVPPGVRTFAHKFGYVIKKTSTVDGVDDTFNGVVNALPASAQPIGALGAFTLGAALVVPAAIGATLNSRDKFAAYRNLLTEIVGQQSAVIRSLERDQASLHVLIELQDLAEQCRALTQHDRWQRVKRKTTLDASSFKSLSTRFAELARAQIGTDSPPSTVHQVLEYERSEQRRSIANLERVASLGNAGGMISMTGALVTGAGKSAAKVAVQHSAAHSTVAVGGALAEHGIGIATSGVFAAGQLMQCLFGASRVVTGTQCRAMLQAELKALAKLEGRLDSDTYDCLRETVQRLLELNELIYVRSGALLGLGQLLMVGGSVATLAGGAATLGAAAVPGTVLSVTGTVLTLAGVAGQVRGDIRKEKFSGEPSSFARRTIEQRDIARLIDECGLADAVDQVADLLDTYQREVVGLKTLSLATQAIGREKHNHGASSALPDLRQARIQRLADTFGAFRNRTTLLLSDKAGLTRARQELGQDFLTGSREQVEARIHAALLVIPESEAITADRSFQRIVLYKTLHKLRSSSDPEVRRFLEISEFRLTKTISLAQLTQLERRLPQVRAEHIHQVNKLLLPRLRNDMKALRLDTARRLTRLAEVMAEMDRLREPAQASIEPDADERLI